MRKALQLRFQDGGTDIEQMMKEKGEEVVPWLNYELIDLGPALVNLSFRRIGETGSKNGCHHIFNQFKSVSGEMPRLIHMDVAWGAPPSPGEARSVLPAQYTNAFWGQLGCMTWNATITCSHKF